MEYSRRIFTIVSIACLLLWRGAPAAAWEAEGGIHALVIHDDGFRRVFQSASLSGVRAAVWYPLGEGVFVRAALGGSSAEGTMGPISAQLTVLDANAGVAYRPLTDTALQPYVSVSGTLLYGATDMTDEVTTYRPRSWSGGGEASGGVEVLFARPRWGRIGAYAEIGWRAAPPLHFSGMGDISIGGMIGGTGMSFIVY